MSIQTGTAGILVNNCAEVNLINNGTGDIAKKRDIFNDHRGQHVYVCQQHCGHCGLNKKHDSKTLLILANIQTVEPVLWFNHFGRFFFNLPVDLSIFHGNN